MKKAILLGLVCLFLMPFEIDAQTTEETKQKIESLERKKEEVRATEKEALKKEVIAINKRLENGEITEYRAELLKKEAAEKHASNINNKIAIIDNSISLLKREESTDEIVVFDDENEFIAFNIGDDINISVHSKEKRRKYDVRTYGELVVAFGLNNADIVGESLDDSPYSIGRSRFFEMGYSWKTRLLKNSNAIRLKYGFSFTSNGLRTTDNMYFVDNGETTDLELFPHPLDKAKLRMDNFVVPVYFEFGPSRKIERENYIRYSSRGKFKVGLGGYAGVNLDTRQKLKYTENGDKQKDKIKRNYNTSNLIYGVAAYIGGGDVSAYFKYDLNTVFTEESTEQYMMSFGLRFDL